MEDKGGIMALETRKIGRTGVEVTAWGMGCASLGGVGDRITNDDSDAILNAAWDAGIRYFDSAPLYGHGLSEKRCRANIE